MDDTYRKEQIMQMLRGNGKMTTDDIVLALKKLNKETPSPACHDSTVLALISMKRQSIIKGTMNREKRTWEWSLP